MPLNGTQAVIKMLVDKRREWKMAQLNAAGAPKQGLGCKVWGLDAEAGQSHGQEIAKQTNWNLVHTSVYRDTTKGDCIE